MDKKNEIPTVGKMEDLAGWRVEVWYELQVSADAESVHTTEGYFTDTDLATAFAGYKGYGVKKSKVVQVYVLTNDSESGYVLNGNGIKLCDEEQLKTNLIKHAKNKLTAVEKRMLNIE